MILSHWVFVRIHSIICIKYLANKNHLVIDSHYDWLTNLNLVNDVISGEEGELVFRERLEFKSKVKKKIIAELSTQKSVRKTKTTMRRHFQWNLPKILTKGMWNFTETELCSVQFNLLSSHATEKRHINRHEKEKRRYFEAYATPLLTDFNKLKVKVTTILRVVQEFQVRVYGDCSQSIVIRYQWENVFAHS